MSRFDAIAHDIFCKDKTVANYLIQRQKALLVPNGDFQRLLLRTPRIWAFDQHQCSELVLVPPVVTGQFLLSQMIEFLYDNLSRHKDNEYLRLRWRKRLCTNYLNHIFCMAC